jgi:penicillin amidase
MDRDRAEPLIFVAWLRELSAALLAPRLGRLFDDYWNLRPEVVHSILASHPDWCDDPATPAAETCADRLAQSLDRALDGLQRRFGSDIAAWRWGTPHRAQFVNRFWSQVPVLGSWLALAIAADGGNDTVNNGAMPIWDDAHPFADVHGPTLRMIVDMAAPDSARFLVPPGQSGNPLSPHYGDLMPSWRDFAWLGFGEDASGGTLLLSPP